MKFGDVLRIKDSVRHADVRAVYLFTPVEWDGGDVNRHYLDSFLSLTEDDVIYYQIGETFAPNLSAWELVDE
jgi:hypothetical protein